MNETEAFEELTELVVFRTLTIQKLSKLNFEIKEGMTVNDVSNARHLKSG